jgi:hypothetical protein
MSKKDDERWWALHLRVSRGETLSAAERASYEAGLTRADSAERSLLHTADLAELQRLKQAVETLEATRSRLQAQSAEIDHRIWLLEGAYMVLSGFQLSSQRDASIPA